MKNNTMRTVIVSLATMAVMAVGANAFAGKGMGSQGDRRGHGGCGGCGYGQMRADLTPDQREQMKTERQAFFEATKSERQDLYAKRLALRAEMAKRQPDMNKATALQKEVSDLQASLEQKQLGHIMAMRKINPDAGRGWMMEGRGKGQHGMGQGMGYGMGQGMGYGPGNCPNQ
jgi:zinc resistance-associated protein